MLFSGTIYLMALTLHTTHYTLHTTHYTLHTTHSGSGSGDLVAGVVMVKLIRNSVTVLCVALISACGLLLWGGSPEGALQKIAGIAIRVSPSEIRFREGIAVTSDIQVSNIADHSVTVLGGTLPCGCLQFDSLPIRVPSGATISLPPTSTPPPPTWGRNSSSTATR